MRKEPPMRSAALALLTLAAGFASASAGWLPNGNPICVAPGVQQYQSGVADGSGEWRTKPDAIRWVRSRCACPMR